MAVYLRHLRSGCLGLVLSWLAFAALSQNLLEVPVLNARVIDQTATLTDPQRAALDSKLADFETTAGSQLVVLIVPTTAPEDIASYANRVGNAWKIGRKDVGDGLLLVVAKNDRKLRIEVAKTLEGAVPDVAAKHVIDELITPRYKQGDFAGGLDAGVERLMQLVRNEELPAPAPHASGRAIKALVGLFGVADVALMLALGVSSIFGALFFSATGALAAAVTWFFSESFLATLVMGVVGYAFGIYALARWAAKGNKNTAVSGVATPAASTPADKGSTWWSSADRSDSSSFSSGAGGDFGGGGASGSW